MTYQPNEGEPHIASVVHAIVFDPSEDMSKLDQKLKDILLVDKYTDTRAIVVCGECGDMALFRMAPITDGKVPENLGEIQFMSDLTLEEYQYVMKTMFDSWGAPEVRINKPSQN